MGVPQCIFFLRMFHYEPATGVPPSRKPPLQRCMYDLIYKWLIYRRETYVYIYIYVCVVLKGLRHPCVVLCECRQAGVLAAEAVILHTKLVQPEMQVQLVASFGALSPFWICPSQFSESTRHVFHIFSSKIVHSCFSLFFPGPLVLVAVSEYRKVS